MSKKVKLTAGSWHDISFRYEKTYDVEDIYGSIDLSDDDIRDMAYDDLVPDFIHEAIEVDVEVFGE